jgi:hypothetical protein
VELLTTEVILAHIEREIAKHRATLDNLKQQGKTYRNRSTSFETGCLNTLRDLRDTIELPRKNAELEEAMKRFARKT